MPDYHLPFGSDGYFTDTAVDDGHRFLRGLMATFGNLGERESRVSEETIVADECLFVLRIEEGEQVLQLMLLLVGGTFVGKSDEVGVERLGKSIHWLEGTEAMSQLTGRNQRKIPKGNTIRETTGKAEGETTREKRKRERHGFPMPSAQLSVLIHVVVVLLVVARGDIVEPFLVVEIPADGLLNAFLELK